MEPDLSSPADRSGRRPRRGAILGGSVVVLLLLAAAGYFYSVRDAGQESPVPASEQAAPPATKDVASAPAENAAPAPSQPAPSSQPTPSSQPPREATAAPAATPAPSPSPQPETPAPAAQTPAPAESPPTESAAQTTPAPPASMRNQQTSLPGEEIVVVERPRVNIRAEPNAKAKVVGSAAQGSQFKVVRRVGNWVQVEGDAGSGWISGRLVGARSP